MTNATTQDALRGELGELTDTLAALYPDYLALKDEARKNRESRKAYMARIVAAERRAHEIRDEINRLDREAEAAVAAAEAATNSGE